MNIEDIARVTHETNAAYCRAIGDDSQPPWEAAPNWQRASAVSGVQFVLDNPTAGDAAQHNNWADDKRAHGWSYGAEKDPELKTHPCLVPFEELPPEQQAKDRLFRAVVLALAPLVARGQG